MSKTGLYQVKNNYTVDLNLSMLQEILLWRLGVIFVLHLPFPVFVTVPFLNLIMTADSLLNLL